MKHVLITILAILYFTSCNNISTTKMATTEHEKIVKQYYDHFNNHEWVKMAEMYSETSDFKDPSLGNGIVKQTRQQIVEKYSGLSKIFPDVKDEIVQVYPSSDKHIIVEFISTGTTSDGSKFELPICTIFTIENGKITKDFTYYDNFEEPEQ
ncbi:MAG: nuclear transport factor 2 family protein [Flavobacterium sp.]|uniref:nuclear transport factor 2 family protein n=1 Tax=Flavobacterium sp. TaxID=239 RepID=UPI0025C46A22|nr:nuclear transport factor 2 family protein [Flavobacterium sp.]MCK6609164.1 nuclear transport factor 2 family protein [Flavobacterium sp.]